MGEDVKIEFFQSGEWVNITGGAQPFVIKESGTESLSADLPVEIDLVLESTVGYWSKLFSDKMTMYPYGKGRLRPYLVAAVYRSHSEQRGEDYIVSLDVQHERWHNRWTIPFWRLWYAVVRRLKRESSPG